VKGQRRDMIRNLQKLYLSALFMLGVGLIAFLATLFVRGIVHPVAPANSIAASTHLPEVIAENSTRPAGPRVAQSPFGALDRESMFRPAPELIALAAHFARPRAPESQPTIAQEDRLQAGPEVVETASLGDPRLRDNDSVPRATFTIASRDALGAAREQRGSLRILQIGDSHTAADLFTGEVRKELQARYGDGGAGYVDIGQPHPGVRSAVLKTSLSEGWTYNALQKSGDASRFYLSGFDAEASRSGERLVFTAPQVMPYDVIEIEFVASPGSGSVDITLDDLPPIHRSLVSSKRDRIVERLLPDGSGPRQISKLSITTTENKPVIVSSVSIVNTTYGVSYSNVGYPGATIDIVNKFDPRLFGHELQRINPQIVVLAFGTNEGFNDNLDLAAYRERYLDVIGMIRKNLPMARIVLIGPADGNRVSLRGAARRAESADAYEGSCPWPTPPKLRGVREVQRQIAEDQSLPFWDWSGIMARKCGAHAWFTANPRLMAADHVHFTAEGYRTSGRAFAEFLMPLVSPLRRENYALSHH
jgi:lysophospholipase L1-like esterase